ncbi:MAG: hypothetical protein ACJA0H_002128, partial [Francisellaceae bacterium]
MHIGGYYILITIEYQKNKNIRNLYMFSVQVKVNFSLDKHTPYKLKGI